MRSHRTTPTHLYRPLYRPRRRTADDDGRGRARTCCSTGRNDRTRRRRPWHTAALLSLRGVHDPSQPIAIAERLTLASAASGTAAVAACRRPPRRAHALLAQSTPASWPRASTDSLNSPHSAAVSRPHLLPRIDPSCTAFRPLHHTLTASLERPRKSIHRIAGSAERNRPRVAVPSRGRYWRLFPISRAVSARPRPNVGRLGPAAAEHNIGEVATSAADYYSVAARTPEGGSVGSRPSRDPAGRPHRRSTDLDSRCQVCTNLRRSLAGPARRRYGP
jgi:hypothetical protein